MLDLERSTPSTFFLFKKKSLISIKLCLLKNKLNIKKIMKYREHKIIVFLNFIKNKIFAIKCCQMILAKKTEKGIGKKQLWLVF